MGRRRTEDHIDNRGQIGLAGFYNFTFYSEGSGEPLHGLRHDRLLTYVQRATLAPALGTGGRTSTLRTS